MSEWEYNTPGIADDCFIRDEVPMTKEEVRAVLLSKLRLKKNQVVYDIGAGSGSVAIEMALVLKKGKVYALERKKKALNLIKKNVIKFNINNIEIIAAEAPAGIDALPGADRIFIGGSGGQLTAILEAADQKLKDTGRIVLTAVTINTLTTAVQELERLDYHLDIVNVAVTRTKDINKYKMFRALSPVYIISAVKN
ncbi:MULTISPECIES: precorrin-6Y C5,15-methyltransferase (decarboxylating) subunit CbiT [unclassified Halanaerobium]|uniref:precorrin-6Y C5,15-methyltransferase (decarboxylating) subunit CbiT n=1 Tax=unclassified Halanaerobium TaxID=2641197 RepID=UPI000DF354B6|nr:MULTISPECIES: precorrin-6Y C5,15-methyltransferase (decarboxylating) subunit CbiT [unclassified Halanaerobium]RCW50436.1 cobalt-precorrin 7 C15-methyltransferase [Halanaerobium sp. MA284_MarDTE_T2]RCW84219.1 cobalt-precorrin 7 C15-methyltransferase [Halanaerobium sp. DL-01]